MYLDSREESRWYGLVRHDGHLTDLRVLLLDQILPGFPLDLAAEEQFQAAVEGIKPYSISASRTPTKA